MSKQLLTTAPPTDAVEFGEVTLTLSEQIDYAQWQVICAQAHLDDLLAKKAALDTEQIDQQYQEHLDAEFGKACIESDKADAEVMRCLSN